MNNRKRLLIIIVSVFAGTLISAGLYMVRRGGNITGQDIATLFTNMAFALAIVIVIGLVLKGRKNREEK